MNVDHIQTVRVHRWNHPVNIWIAGPTQSGKTEFVKKMIRHRKTLFRPSIQEVVIIYSMWQDTYDEMKNEFPDIIWVRGLPNNPFKYFKKEGKPGRHAESKQSLILFWRKIRIIRFRAIYTWIVVASFTTRT